MPKRKTNWFTSINVVLTIYISGNYCYFTYIENHRNKLFSWPTAITLFSFILFVSTCTYNVLCSYKKNTPFFLQDYLRILWCITQQQQQKLFITRDTIQEIHKKKKENYEYIHIFSFILFISKKKIKINRKPECMETDGNHIEYALHSMSQQKKSYWFLTKF